ncbi:MAG: FKBP-type peptidyl-prolyl cis-trans isomerase [Myxococcales bacterium]|nr:FKBP-type peptidyl-prolyl cis-trans isomerase [Myxococcales bacterium]
MKFDAPFDGAPIATETRDGGLKVEDFAAGEGAPAAAGSSVEVHYTGYLTDGSVFDSSVPRGRPFSFDLGAGRVIKGWDQGIVGMKVGGLRKLVIPAELAYGERARGKIPANSRLTFLVEVMATKPMAPPPGAPKH